MSADASDHEGKPVAAGWHAIVLASNPQVELCAFKMRMTTQVALAYLQSIKKIIQIQSHCGRPTMKNC
jgi:hypothetical protein